MSGHLLQNRQYKTLTKVPNFVIVRLACSKSFLKEDGVMKKGIFFSFLFFALAIFISFPLYR